MAFCQVIYDTYANIFYVVNHIQLIWLTIPADITESIIKEQEGLPGKIKIAHC